MSSDNEHKFGDAGDVNGSDSADITAADAPVFQSRPFRSWASALEEEKPSLWSRIRSRFAAFLRRPAATGIVSAAEQRPYSDAAQSLGDRSGTDQDFESTRSAGEAQEIDQWEKPWPGEDGASEQSIETDVVGETAPSDRLADSSPVSPPQDFRFPWTRPEELPGEAAIDAPGLSNAAREARRDFFEAPTELIPDIERVEEPEPPRPGFFARLFARKTRDVSPPPAFVAEPAPQPDEFEEADAVVQHESLALDDVPSDIPFEDAAVADRVAADAGFNGTVPADAADGAGQDRAFEDLFEDAATPPAAESAKGDNTPAANASEARPWFDDPAPPAQARFEPDEPVSSPATEATSVPFAANDEPPPPEAKPGFFARLFGRKVKPELPAEPVSQSARFEEEVAIVRTNEYPADIVAEDIREAYVHEESAVDETVSEETVPEETVSEETVPEETVVEESAVEESVPLGQPWLNEPAPTAERNFASVEEALPSAESPTHAPPAHDTFEPFEQPQALPPEPKPGFFARLMGRRSKSTPRPSLEIEIHEDRIAAAANALEAVGQQTFSDDVVEPVARSDVFASVEDALPEYSRFAPPAGVPEGVPLDPEPDAEEMTDAEMAPDVRATIEVAQESRSTIEVSRQSVTDSRDTIEVARDDRKTADVSAYFGETLEVVRDKPPTPDASAYFGDTIDIDVDAPRPRDMAAYFGETVEIVPERRETADSGAYFGDTLEPGHFGETTEVEKDTDEFEVVAAPAPDDAPAVPGALPSDLDADTAQVSQKSLIERLIFWRAKAKADAGLLDGGTTVVEGNTAFLFTKFRTFYNEIIRSKHQKTEFTAGFSTAIVTDYAADLSPDSAAEALSKNLAAMLDLQAAEAMWMGGESAERYPDAQYAMAALADETFLHTVWEGQGAWHKNLIEVRMFKTHAADVELFRRIDKLLKDQPNSAVARDLARVYLFVIAAGFRGKYRPFGLTRALAEYRQRLYEYIHQGGDALMIYAPDRRIFPDAAKRTLEGEAASRFTSAQRWAAILVFLIVGYTLVAHVAWSRVSADLKDVTDRIIAGNTTTGAP